jgi:protein phosphatase
MGGAQAGELASNLAAAALRDEGSRGGGEERVDELIQEANRRVYERQTQDSSATGMGTTMTVALVEDGHVAIGHVGDSRAYLIRDRGLEQLTEDHSLVAELVRSGKLSPEEAEAHPQRSVITRALGTDPDVDVDTFSVETRPETSSCSARTASRRWSTTRRSCARSSATASDLTRGRRRSCGREQGRRRGQHHRRLLRDRRGGETGDTARMVTLPPIEGDEKRHARRARRRAGGPRRGARAAASEHTGRGVLFALLALVLVVRICGFAAWGLWRSHFVGAEPDGHVAVYQGVPWNIVGNVKLYRAVYVSPLLTAQLSQAERQKLFDHTLRSDGSARAEVRRYEEQIGAR